MLSKGIGALVLGLVLCLGVHADDKEMKKDKEGATKDSKFSNPDAGKCPVSHKAVDEKITVTIEGKTYDFCCEKCQAKFKEHPEKFLKKEKKDK